MIIFVLLGIIENAVNINGRYDMTKQKNLIPLLLLLYAVWGFNWVVMKIANDYYPAAFFVACRFTIGAAALLVVCIARGKLLPPKNYWPWIILTGVLGMALNMLLVQLATKYLGAGLPAVLDYTQSVFVCILAAVFLGEKLTIRKVVGIILSIAGLLILTNVEQTGNTWAIGLGIGAAVAWAVSNIFVKTKLQGCDMVQYTGWQMGCGALVMWIYAFASPGGQVVWAPMGIVCMIYTGLIASALAWFLWNYLLVKMEAGQASIAVMAVPAVGVLCGIIFLGEPMTMSIALGMVILFAGILIVLGLGEKKS